MDAKCSMVLRVWLQAGGHGLEHLGPGRSAELGLARTLGAGGGPVQVGQRSHRSPRHLGSAVGGMGVLGGGPGGPWPPLAKIFCLAEQNWVAWQKGK